MREHRVAQLSGFSLILLFISLLHPRSNLGHLSGCRLFFVSFVLGGVFMDIKDMQVVEIQ